MFALQTLAKLCRIRKSYTNNRVSLGCVALQLLAPSHEWKRSEELRAAASAVPTTDGEDTCNNCNISLASSWVLNPEHPVLRFIFENTPSVPRHGILVDVSSSATSVQFKMQMIELSERFVLQKVVEIIDLPFFPCIHRL